MMNSLTNSLGSDRFFSIALIGISAMLYSMLGGMDEATSPGELAASTYPRLLLVCVMVFCASLLFTRKNATEVKAQFPLSGIAVIGAIALYIFLVDMIGYFLLTPVLLIALPLLAGFTNLKLTLVSAVCVTGALYCVFDLVLNIPLPAGLLGS
ncbi:tripartite tricarboxylate transporter TctB family protein [Vibrio sp. Vb339]|uniref:tripartite tricarboxylate transporter TctB family protein n=1 Tax=Vibrio sp. Vb339 TaxID=1192013 RepID=UPI001556DAA2|nr:tripartite tricarboxylate transporter TctB family protein [Vibrio sp. Vb339]